MLLDYFEGVRPTGPNQWLARCPGPNHQNGDRHPSLSVRLIEGDRWLLNCFSLCATIDICGAIGIGLGDLFVDGRAKRDYQHGKDRNDQALPRVRATDFLELAAQEAWCVALIAADIRSSKSIDSDTWERLATAYKRLSTARDLVLSRDR